MKKSFKVRHVGYESTLVTAENEIEAVKIAKNLIPSLSGLIFDEENEEKVINMLIKTERIIVEELKKPEKKLPYYVSTYTKYPIYEPAEGGYFYNGIQLQHSKGFQTFKDAKRYLRKCYKESIEFLRKYDEDIISGGYEEEYWYCSKNHQRFGVVSIYYGEGWYIKLERKQGSEVSGYIPYC